MKYLEDTQKFRAIFHGPSRVRSVIRSVSRAAREIEGTMGIKKGIRNKRMRWNQLSVKSCRREMERQKYEKNLRRKERTARVEQRRLRVWARRGIERCEERGLNAKKKKRKWIKIKIEKRERERGNDCGSNDNTHDHAERSLLSFPSGYFWPDC